MKAPRNGQPIWQVFRIGKGARLIGQVSASSKDDAMVKARSLFPRSSSLDVRQIGKGGGD